MAYVEVAHSWPGNNLIVLLNGRPVPARVTPTPFFDPQNARLRARPQDDEKPAEPAMPAPQTITAAPPTGRGELHSPRVSPKDAKRARK
jgi:aminomethyltransferase